MPNQASERQQDDQKLFFLTPLTTVAALMGITAGTTEIRGTLYQSNPSETGKNRHLRLRWRLQRRTLEFLTASGYCNVDTGVTGENPRFRHAPTDYRKQSACVFVRLAGTDRSAKKDASTQGKQADEDQ